MIDRKEEQSRSERRIYGSMKYGSIYESWITGDPATVQHTMCIAEIEWKLLVVLNQDPVPQFFTSVGSLLECF